MPNKGWWAAMVMSTLEQFEGALCASDRYNPEMWTISRDSNSAEDVRKSHHAAQAVCLRCPAMVKCGRYALEHPELNGVWGGMLDEQRVEMRKRVQLMR